MKFQDRYASRGVSSGKEEVHAAVARMDKGLFPRAFCKILPDHLGSDPDFCNISHSDGAGTKASLAYVYWREHDDLSVWTGIAQDALIMNVDDLLCVGAADNLLLSSSIDRNKHLVPGTVVEALIRGTEDVMQRLREFGVGIYSGGGETADVGDLARTIVVNASCFARLARSKVVDAGNIRAGDVIVGLASFGQAKYEESYNSGMGSNGLTSARHDLFSDYYAHKYPESYDPATPADLIYCGSKRLDDPLEGTPLTVGQAVLSPTRTYSPVILTLLREMRPALHGIIHCTGGAQTKVMKFVEGVQVIKDNLFPCPPLFRLIQGESGTSWQEMYRTFNMGHRMEVYVSEQDSERVIKTAQNYGIEAQVVGRVESAPAKRLVVRSEFGEFIY